jgi:DNA-binding CsgD family transcriptional regulator
MSESTESVIGVANGHAGANERELDWLLSEVAAGLYCNLLKGAAVGADVEGACELVQFGFATVDPVMNCLICLPPEVGIMRAMAHATDEWLRSRPNLSVMERDLVALSKKDTFVARSKGSEAATTNTAIPTQQGRAAAVSSLFHGARCELLMMSRTQVRPDEDWRNLPQQSCADVREAERSRFLQDHQALFEGGEILSETLEEIRLGAQVRILPSLPSNFIVADRAVAVIHGDDGGETIRLTSPGLVLSLCALFEALWVTAVPLGGGSVVDPGLSETHEIILSELLAGRPIDAIARTLKLHRRTIHRKANDIYDAYKVTSRSELMAVVLNHQASGLAVVGLAL